jgi:hypothetical protein
MPDLDESSQPQQPFPPVRNVQAVGITFPGTVADLLGQVGVDLSVSSELAYLGSIFGDLLVAGMAAHHVKDPNIQGPEHLFLRRACWEAATIAYGRTFMKGKVSGEHRGLGWMGSSPSLVRTYGILTRP